MRSLLGWAALGLVGAVLGGLACGGSDETSPGTGGAGATGGQASGGGGSSAGGGGASVGGGGSSSGGGGSSAGGGGSSAGGGGASAGGGGSGGSLPLPARLFVSMADAPVAVWDDASTLATDTGPSFSLQAVALAAGARGLALHGDRLFVGGESASALLLAFDGASTLGQSAAPSATIPSTQFLPAGGTEGAELITVDTATNTLWATTFLAGTELFHSASSLTSAANASARLTHNFQQLPAFAYDAAGDRAFAGQISGAGILAWDGASSASTTPPSDFTLAGNIAAWSMTVAQNRLFATGSLAGAPTTEIIAVWTGVTGLSGPTAPTFTMGAASGIAPTDFSPYIGVQGNVLVSCIQAGKVLLWTNASGLTGDATPTQTIAGLSSPKKALLGPKSGRLYVLENNGISIFDTPTTAPTLAVKLTGGVVAPRDMALLE